MRARLVEQEHKFTYFKPKTEEELAKAYEEVYKMSYEKAKKIVKKLGIKPSTGYNNHMHFKECSMIPDIIKLLTTWYHVTEMHVTAESGYFQKLITFDDKMKYFSHYIKYDHPSLLGSMPRLEKALQVWFERNSYMRTMYDRHKKHSDEQVYKRFKSELGDMYFKMMSIK